MTEGWTSNSPIVVDSSPIAWVEGIDTLKSMTEESVASLGPEEAVAREYARYRRKDLYANKMTTRNIALFQLDAGYSDPTYCYHHTAEEALVLSGEIELRGSEGLLQEGDYFWRPPGWVHGGTVKRGCEMLVCVQGESQDSGRADRHIRPAEEAGTNSIYDADDVRAIGPRGWVRRLESRFVPWQKGTLFARSEGDLAGYDLERISFKVLSKDPEGGQSLLVRLHPGYRQESAGTYSADHQMFVVSGALTQGDVRLSTGWFTHRPAKSIQPAMESADGAILFLKSDGPLDFHPHSS